MSFIRGPEKMCFSGDVPSTKDKTGLGSVNPASIRCLVCLRTVLESNPKATAATSQPGLRVGQDRI